MSDRSASAISSHGVATGTPHHPGDGVARLFARRDAEDGGWFQVSGMVGVQMVCAVGLVLLLLRRRGRPRNTPTRER